MLVSRLVSLTTITPASKLRTGRKVMILEDFEDSSQRLRCFYPEIDREVSVKLVVV